MSPLPKEQVNYPDDDEFVAPEEGSSPAPVHGVSWLEPIVNVNWISGGEYSIGHVQVSMDCSPTYYQYVVGDVTDERERLTVFSPVLDRAQLNRMIKVLRRARDSAYGHDE